MKVEGNADARLKLIHDALMMHTSEAAHLMLHQQIIPWAMRKNVTATHSADNRLRMWWVHVD